MRQTGPSRSIDRSVSSLGVPVCLASRVGLRSMSTGPLAARGGEEQTARARIIDTAYRLFSQFGVSAIGIDRIVDGAHVAKMTLYRHFTSKEDLVLAFLVERRRRWTHQWLKAATEHAAPDRRDRPLALFDVLDEWFHRPDYEGCSFIRTLHEVSGGPIHDAAERELEEVRRMLVDHAAQAGVGDAESFSYQMQILMMGSMVSALRGDLDAAQRARRVAAPWLAQATIVRR